MKAIELHGQIDAQHQLQVQVPPNLASGPVRVIVLIPEEDDAGAVWMQGIVKEWAAELSDPQEDLYTLTNGRPVDAAR